MLTDKQIRGARELPGWFAAHMSRGTFLKLDVIEAAERGGDGAVLSDGQALAVRRICGRASVEFTAGSGEGSGVRSRKGT